MQQFNRKIIVQAGKIGEPGIQVTNLRVTFNIKKTSRSDSYNTASVVIYNLNSDSRDGIAALNYTDLKDASNILTVRAGYEALEKTIYVGNISLVNIELKRPDAITTIEASDGYIAMNQLRIGTVPPSGIGGIPAFTYGKQTSAKKVLHDILKISGLTVKYNINSIPDRLYANGFSFIGMGKVLLDNVCNYLGLEWSIQNNCIKLFPVDTSDGISIVSLSPTCGLIGSPERSNIDNKELTKKELGMVTGKSTTALGKKIKKRIGGGWKIKALLQPEVEPGNIIMVESDEIPFGTQLRVIEVEHVGDTHGQDWTSTIYAKVMGS